jgi:hypothetical protein
VACLPVPRVLVFSSFCVVASTALSCKILIFICAIAISYRYGLVVVFTVIQNVQVQGTSSRLCCWAGILSEHPVGKYLYLSPPQHSASLFTIYARAGSGGLCQSWRVHHTRAVAREYVDDAMD